MAKKLDEYRIVTLNNPMVEETSGARWVTLPFIRGFEATRDAKPQVPAPHDYPAGEYYLIPAKDMEDLDFNEMLEVDEGFDVLTGGLEEENPY